MDGADGIVTPKVNTSRQDTIDSAETSLRRIDVYEILRGQRELILMLQETEYRLRITSKGKLILTK